MTILTIDSSSKSAAAGLYRDGHTLGESFLCNGLTHSETLGPILENLLYTARVSAKEIDKIAVTNGPGSFTGLRIGVAAALGLAMSAGAECVGVSSLEAAAQSFRHWDGLICAAMDARRGQIYTALFEAGGGALSRLTEDIAVPAEEMLSIIAGRSAYVTGDGAELLPAENIREIPGMRYITARGVYLCCADGHERPAEELCYLRLPQAERERLERLGKDAGSGV